MTVPYDILQDVLKVINTISTGETPTAACDIVGLAYSTFCTYTTRYPELNRMRTEAEDRLYDLMAEALPHIYDHHIYGVEDPKMAGVVSSNIKWLLERRRQKAYGAHSVVEHQITADREVLDALQRAKARAQGTVIDVVVNEVLDIPILSEDTLSGMAESDEERRIRELAEIS